MKYFIVEDSLDEKVVGKDFPQAYKFIKGYNPDAPNMLDVYKRQVRASGCLLFRIFWGVLYLAEFARTPLTIEANLWRVRL